MANNSKIAFTTYVVSQYMNSLEESRETLRRVREIGYQNVEVGFPLPFPVKEFSGMLAEVDLQVIDMHIWLQEYEANYDAIVALAHQWGCTHLTIPMIDMRTMQVAEDWRILARTATELGKRLAADGITLQYHNHHFEFQHFEGKSALEIIYAESDPAYLKAQLDTHWVARGGGEPTKWLKKMTGRMDQVHFKDLVINQDNEAVFADVGKGNLNWTDIIDICKTENIQYYIVEEDPGPHMPDPFKSLENSMNFLNSMGIE